MRLRTPLSLFPLLLILSGVAYADSLSFTGSLDPNNPNDVYLATFTLSSSSDLIVQSWGYGGSSGAPGGTNAAGTVIPPGGFDTYLSLFNGTGSTATFVASNDDGGCVPASPDPASGGYCEDSRLDLTDLAAGSYTIALTLPDNYSIAENYGYGDLGDGFINLQGSYYDYATGEVRSSDFAFDITADGLSSSTPPTSATPEPSSIALLGTGLALAAGHLRRRFISTAR
jgi:PEP-CTERM motif